LVPIVEDGTIAYDSPVILEYLDHRAGGGRIIPARGGARWRAAEHREPRWLAHRPAR